MNVTATSTSSAIRVKVSGRPSTGHSRLPKISGTNPVTARLDDDAQPKPEARSSVG